MQNAYRVHARVDENGTLTLENLPFSPGEVVEVIVLAEARPRLEETQPLGDGVHRHDDPADADAEDEWDPEADALSVLEGMIESVDAPPDWAAEHDHFLYGTPKRRDQQP